MNYNKQSHKVYLLNYHFISVVKYRKDVFTNNDIINDFKEIVNNIANNFDVEILEHECGTDHYHLVFSAKPTLDIPKFINILKGHSSRDLRKKHKVFLKDKLWGDSFWSPSYFLATTGNVSLDKLIEYVENQRKELN